MRRLIAVPTGWPCKYKEVPPGHFTDKHEQVCFRDEYGSAGNAFNSAGEIYHGDPESEVQPIVFEWEEYEE